MEHYERGGRSWSNRQDTASHLEQEALALQAHGRLKEAAEQIAGALKKAGSPLERSRVLCTQSAIRLDLGEFEGATDAAWRAFECLDDELPGTDAGTDRLRVRAMRRIASGMLQGGRFDDARPLLERAFGYCQRWLDAESEEACRVLTLLGTLEKEAGVPHMAEEYYRRALELAERLWDPFSGEVATLCHYLALLADGWEEGDLLQPFAERACEIRCGLFGSTHPLSAAAQTGLALTLETAGEDKRAGEKFLYAMAIFDRHYAGEQCARSILPESLRDYAICRAGTVRYLLTCGRSADAREFSVRALSVFRNVLGKRHPLTTVVERDHASLLRTTPGTWGLARPGSGWNWWRGFSFSR